VNPPKADVDGARIRPAKDPRVRDTLEMINDCFRHQHPEAYGRDPVPQAGIPWHVQCGRDHLTPSSPPAIPEESMGDPDARSLDAGRSDSRPPEPARPPRWRR